MDPKVYYRGEEGEVRSRSNLRLIPRKPFGMAAVLAGAATGISDAVIEPTTLVERVEFLALAIPIIGSGIYREIRPREFSGSYQAVFMESIDGEGPKVIVQEDSDATVYLSGWGKHMGAGASSLEKGLMALTAYVGTRIPTEIIEVGYDTFQRLF